jgi:hypothetical protein
VGAHGVIGWAKMGSQRKMREEELTEKISFMSILCVLLLTHPPL